MVSTITAKDLLSPPLLLNPDTVTTDTDTDMDTVTITAKGLLKPNPITVMVMPLMPTMVTVTVMLTDTDTDTVTITAKGLLKPNPITVMVMLLMPTMVTVTVMVTVMAMVIMVMASKFILLSFLSNYYNGCVYKKFYDSENFDLRSTVPEVESLAY